jgi:predicted nucleic acid-binding protein
MIVSIDVCGAMEILMQREKAEKFGKALQEATLVVAPDLYVSELTNTMWKYHRAGLLNSDECIQCIQDGINYIDKFVGSKDLWQEAFSEGLNNSHSIYDMFYMATTKRYDATLITTDSALAKICKNNNVKIC